jgi:hypothetical protein
MIALLIWVSNGHLIILHIYLRCIGVTTYEFIIRNRMKRVAAEEKIVGQKGPRKAGMRLTPRSRRFIQNKRREELLDTTKEDTDMGLVDLPKPLEKIPPKLRASHGSPISSYDTLKGSVIAGSSYISV